MNVVSEVAILYCDLAKDNIQLQALWIPVHGVSSFVTDKKSCHIYDLLVLLI